MQRAVATGPLFRDHQSATPARSGGGGFRRQREEEIIGAPNGCLGGVGHVDMGAVAQAREASGPRTGPTYMDGDHRVARSAPTPQMWPVHCLAGRCRGICGGNAAFCRGSCGAVAGSCGAVAGQLRGNCGQSRGSCEAVAGGGGGCRARRPATCSLPMSAIRVHIASPDPRRIRGRRRPARALRQAEELNTGSEQDRRSALTCDPPALSKERDRGGASPAFQLGAAPRGALSAGPAVPGAGL